MIINLKCNPKTFYVLKKLYNDNPIELNTKDPLIAIIFESLIKQHRIGKLHDDNIKSYTKEFSVKLSKKHILDFGIREFTMHSVYFINKVMKHQFDLIFYLFYFQEKTINPTKKDLDIIYNFINEYDIDEDSLITVDSLVKDLYRFRNNKKPKFEKFFIKSSPKLVHSC